MFGVRIETPKKEAWFISSIDLCCRSYQFHWNHNLGVRKCGCVRRDFERKKKCSSICGLSLFVSVPYSVSYDSDVFCSYCLHFSYCLVEAKQRNNAMFIQMGVFLSLFLFPGTNRFQCILASTVYMCKHVIFGYVFIICKLSFAASGNDNRKWWNKIVFLVICIEETCLESTNVCCCCSIYKIWIW